MAGRGVYRNRRKKNLSRLYFLIVLLLGLVMFKWGFKLLIRIMAKTGGEKTQTTEAADLVPPQTPVISALPEATNSGQIKIEGYTEAGAEVDYFVNDRRIISERADSTGFYQAVLDLREGDNFIKVAAKDEAGNQSSSEEARVIYDFKPPEIRLDSPTEAQEFFGQQEEVISVYGEVSEPEASLKINNTYVSLDDKGLFDQQVKLNEGENEIRVAAIDAAGNVSEKVVKVTYAR